jgi:hypothetical protein
VIDEPVHDLGAGHLERGLAGVLGELAAERRFRVSRREAVLPDELAHLLHRHRKRTVISAVATGRRPAARCASMPMTVSSRACRTSRARRG